MAALLEALRVHVLHVKAHIHDDLTTDEVLVRALASLEASVVELRGAVISGVGGELRCAECAEVRERAANAEARLNEQILKNRALSLELEASRREGSRLKRAAHQTEAASRPRAGSGAPPATSPGDSSALSPPCHPRAAVSRTLTGSDGGEDGGQVGRLRASTRESASSAGGSYNNLTAFFSARPLPMASSSPPPPLPAAQAQPMSVSPLRVPLPARYRSRAGSAPQPLSPSRVLPAGPRHSATAYMVERVYGRSSPQPDGGSLSAASSCVGLDELLGLTLGEWQDRDAQTGGRKVVEAVGRPSLTAAAPPALPPRSNRTSLWPWTVIEAPAVSEAQLLPLAASSTEGSSASNEESKRSSGSGGSGIAGSGETPSDASSGSPLVAAVPGAIAEVPPIAVKWGTFWSSIVGGQGGASAVAPPSPPPAPSTAAASPAPTPPQDDHGPSPSSAFLVRSRSLPSILLRAAMASDSSSFEEATPSPHGHEDVTATVFHAQPTSPAGPLLVSPTPTTTTSRPSVDRLLAAVPLFASLTHTERHILAKSCAGLRASPGEVIVAGNAGEEAGLYLLLSGTVSIMSGVVGRRADGGERVQSGDESSRVLAAGSHFSSTDVPPGSVAIARTPTLLLLLHAGALHTLLAWFAEARGIGHLASERGGGERADPSARIRALIAAAPDLPAYVAALRRAAPFAHGLPLPARRPLRLPALKREVDQSFRDLTRESGVLLNGSFKPLGTPERFQSFVASAAEVVRAEFARLAGGAGALEGVVASVTCDLLTSSCRTATGGDAFVQASLLFGRPELVFVAAESGGQAPTELTVGDCTLSIISFSTFKVCAMAEEEDGGAGSAGGGRGRSDTAGSMGSHALVWALLRCRLEDVITYHAGRAPHVKEGAAAVPGIASAFAALWAHPKAAPPVGETAAEAACEAGAGAAPAEPAPTVLDMETAVAGASSPATVHSTWARKMDVQVHVFERPENA
jgi:hypothetical protein